MTISDRTLTGIVAMMARDAEPLAGRTVVIPPFAEHWVCVSYWMAQAQHQGWNEVDLCESEADAVKVGERHLKTGLTAGYRVFRLPGDRVPQPEPTPANYDGLRVGFVGCSFHPASCQCGHCGLKCITARCPNPRQIGLYCAACDHLQGEALDDAKGDEPRDQCERTGQATRDRLAANPMPDGGGE